MIFGKKYRCQCYGFSLLEFSIVLVIAGLLIAPLLTLANSVIQRRYADTTNGNIAAVRRALSEYLLVNNRYPCPAPQIRLDAPYAFADACRIVSPIDIAKAKGRGVLLRGAGDKSVLEGAVPYRLLNIPRERAFDAWGHLLTYAVTMDVTQSGVLNTTNGAIAIVDDAGASVVTPAGSALWVVLSHGRDGSGAYTGGETGPDACPGGRLDTANCDHRGAFVVAPYATAAGRAHYDDTLDYLVWPELPLDHDAPFCMLPPAKDGMPHIVQNNATISVCDRVEAGKGSGCSFQLCKNGALIPVTVDLHDDMGAWVPSR